ncbi:hypothetical protein F4825DRAFT_474163 [Nemania diffusa]|nr:hypothetical protein F4825DRAFT_474163 [Nemania diffusa]
MSVDVVSTGSNDSYMKHSIQSLVCTKCNVKYPNIHELLTHQQLERHFACDKCDLFFSAEDDLRTHKRNHHRPELDLECFGCGSHFDRAHTFWRHLENNECKVIFYSDIVKLREKNLKFAQQLELRRSTLDDILQLGESHIKAEDTWASEFGEENAPFEPTTILDPPSRPEVVSPRNVHPLHYRSEDFPLLVTPKKGPTTPNSRRGQWGNTWSNRKAAIAKTPESTPISYTAVPPPISYDTPPAYAPRNATQRPRLNNRIQIVHNSENLTEGDLQSNTLGERIIDPDHPDYNPAVFHNPILGNKKFPNVFTLTKHLRSPAHTGGRVSCICCKKIFSTVANLVGHMESATKCPIREASGFRRALGQATGGIMDFHIRSGMFAIDQKSVQELFNLRSDPTNCPNKSGIDNSDPFVSGQQESYESTEASW